ncbi:MAG: signal peptidase II [Actinomycetota bacterium]|nr:signal peptidase II [Actinomycetota bacterium]
MTGDDASAPVAEATSAPLNPWRLMLPIALLVVVTDQLTKDWAIGSLADGGARHVIWTLQWNLSFNSGMAFSKGQGAGPIIGLLALLVVVLIAVSVRHSNSRTVLVAAGFVMGGALGNLVDRLFRGEGWLHGSVIDFIDFQWFPIFNVADVGVNVGGILFVLWSLFTAKADDPLGTAPKDVSE